jgi:molecular chaperone DnaK (HSP70)
VSWAIDLGTTNTGIARWDDEADRPRLVELPSICRKPGESDHLEAPRLVPSSTHVIEERDFWTRVGTWPFFARRSFLGKLAHIGRPALEMNEGQVQPNFAFTFKPFLSHEALRPIAHASRKTYSAREVAYMFTRELFAEIKRVTGERIRDLVVTTPVESYESYRAEIAKVTKRLGVKRLRFVDEPVAAALGYGLSLRKQRLVLVVDFGGGTLDLALVSITAKEIEAGTCEVIAKEGRAVGGNLVDRWLLEAFCRRLEFPLTEDPGDERVSFWYRMMLTEARRVKEAVFFKPKETFNLLPPDDLRSFEARIRGADIEVEVTKEEIVEILEQKQLFELLDECVDGIIKQANRRGIGRDDIDDVLMVGGSTLLPQIYPRFEEYFGRDRVRAWQPFEAVAYGACAFAAERFSQSDFIVHDYAFVTYDAKTHEPEYTTIVKRGSRFPTAKDHWKRKLIPTCSLGEPETMFKLVICEIGNVDEDERMFSWDAKGELHKLGGKEKTADGPLVVPLNESNPTLGDLKPPHRLSDKRPRLEISFGVNEDRWLVATVFDLLTKKYLMKEETVVRLM